MKGCLKCRSTCNSTVSGEMSQFPTTPFAAIAVSVTPVVPSPGAAVATGLSGCAVAPVPPSVTLLYTSKAPPELPIGLLDTHSCFLGCSRATVSGAMSYLFREITLP